MVFPSPIMASIIVNSWRGHHMNAKAHLDNWIEDANRRSAVTPSFGEGEA